MAKRARSLSDVTDASLSTLATFWVALFALAGAIDLLLDSSVEMVDVRMPLLVVWVVAAAAAVATRALPERTRTPALLLVTVTLAAGTVLTREATGLIAPWIQITLVAGMLTMSIGLLLPYQTVPWAALAVVLLVLTPQRWDEMARADSPVQLGVPLVEGALIVALALLGALIRAVLTQSAARTDADLRRADTLRRSALAERLREDALAAQVALLHDTALNTLNAIALRGGGDQEATRARCREDAQRLRQTATEPAPLSSLTRAIDAAVGRARLLGLDVSLDVEPDTDSADVPSAVVTALAGACDEALLNVTKHAGTARARVRVEHKDGGLTLTIADEGRGFDPTSAGTGFGTEHSIRQRMEAVGGSSLVVTAPGEGTTVRLRWCADTSDDTFVSTVSGTIVRLLVVFMAATTLFTSLVVAAEWAAFERPAVALVGGLLLGGWGLAVTWLLARRRWIPTTVGVLTVALACAAPFWTVASDQYCASSLGGVGWVDPRLPLVVLVILTTGVWWRALAAVPAVVAAALVAGSIWGSAFTGCGGWAVSASVYAVAVLTASLIAGRTLNRQAHELWRATREQDEAEEARVRAAMMRTEQQTWLAPAVAACVPLLTAIGDGTLDPTDADVRRRARMQSGYLRGLIAVAAAPVGVREVLRDVVQRGHAHGLDVGVRGNVGALPAPPADLRATLSRFIPSDLSRADRLTITCTPTARGGEVIVTVPGAAVPASPRADGTADDGGGDQVVVGVEDVGGLWVEISWPGASASPSQQVGTSPTPAEASAREPVGPR